MSCPGDDRTAGAILTIDLDAVAANWRSLAGRLVPGARCAGVVKADAYGLGMAQVAPALARAGCETFFVAQLDEAIALRSLLPEATIAVLGSPVAGCVADYRAHRLLPTLNHRGDIDAWAADGRGAPAILHIDTGMNRLGLSAGEVAALAADPQPLRHLDLHWVMTHLACADEPAHPLSAHQRDAFIAARQQLGLGHIPASVANSAGIFLGHEYHFDLARPGIAVYGGNPVPEQPNPMRATVRLDGRVLQLREVGPGGVDAMVTVGYGAAHTIRSKARLATIGVGYADGYLRSLSGRSRVYVGGVAVPVIGRVSMDLIVADVTALDAGALQVGDLVELIGPHRSVDEVAADAGTISYEILTSLGNRYRRRYLGSGA